ncbi:hypothetical protein LO763_05535 [Glycomyces sp. A-F 0318]|uniref:hypothetical protein n=1 Tax=Glycomyces amatae TaxID=2881355 RepID=UPI001E38F046|nr:hypothetical protein [Glycomyces amatae]MCD0443089.1 hypothetical protein [Glycomyces amatae]
MAGTHWPARRRLKPGDGRALQRFRWWQLPLRSLFWLRPTGGGPRGAAYAVDVRHWAQLDDAKVRAHLFVNGRHAAESKLPAAFPVEGGTVEVAMSAYGIKRCHYVPAAGPARRLAPDPASAEGRRARLEAAHPGLSRGIGAASVLMLVVGLGLNLLQLAEPISQIPPIAERVGTFTSPVRLPLWLNIALAAGAALASMERALRLRYTPLLDLAGN